MKKKGRKLKLEKETLQRLNGRLAPVVGADSVLECVTVISYCTCGYSCGATCLGTCEACPSNNCTGPSCNYTCGGATCGGICEEWL